MRHPLFPGRRRGTQQCKKEKRRKEKINEESRIINSGKQSGSVKTAVMFGADAVYIGGEAFGLRAKAKNFSMEDMKEGIRFAHEHGVKVYVTVNILAHNDDLEGVRDISKN